MENKYTLEDLIGDTPVSEQIAVATAHLALKDHTHDYAPLQEVEALKRKVETLYALVGDTSVSTQIATALNDIK